MRRLRACPKDPAHTVTGTHLSRGGREWYCLDCGLEWRIDARKMLIRYYKIDEEGERTPFMTVDASEFPEFKRLDERNPLYLRITYSPVMEETTSGQLALII